MSARSHGSVSLRQRAIRKHRPTIRPRAITAPISVLDTLVPPVAQASVAVQFEIHWATATYLHLKRSSRGCKLGKCLVDPSAAPRPP